MFKFLFGGGNGTNSPAKVETQRQRIARLVTELNDVIDVMSEKPSFSINMNSGAIAVDLPEQLDDEAIPLPAPAAEAIETVEEVAESKQAA